ncbi:uncharacterized protein YidB (DUF937 family) [Sphaerotilus hippei]|uniref:Uncharacterized protein YidB (DUF937 family) n=1 Tax=Sphaerotilus hippei TaxID=744406 RepID=A0A318H3Q4_9BURK|nr:YidB family protein [Sphaerotilus hippei]PXW96526.1 uncharacterized protein YidB (DUF937 family) [Sphaerotilus hippei]
MGLFDSVLGAVGGQLAGQLGGMLGGGNNNGTAALIGVVMNLLNQPGSEGLGGLLQKFQQGGLGEVAASWVSSGQNLPISADQLQGVLGSDLVGQIAGQLGIEPGAAAGQLAQWLPQVVDTLTPDGQAPSAGTDLGALLPQVLGSLMSRG